MNRGGVGAGRDQGYFRGPPRHIGGDTGHLYQMFQVTRNTECISETNLDSDHR